MRICVVCLGIAVLSGLALAQSPAARDLHLRGDRFQPLTYEAAVYNFGDELLRTREVSDRVFKAAVDTFGERGVVDLTGVMGYYCFVSMMLNIDRYPLPDGEKPELRPLR